MTTVKTIGTRAQVWHGVAKKTPGGLHKKDLMMNKRGRIVSRRKHNTAKRLKILEKAGYKTKKGQFKLFHKHSRSHSRKMKKGGMAYGGPLSPHSYDGEGVGTSGVALQFVAGNASS